MCPTMSTGWLPIKIFRFHPAENIVGRTPQLHTKSPTHHQIYCIPYNKPEDTPSNTSHPFGLLDICCKSSAVCSEQIINSLPAYVCRLTLDLWGVVKKMMNTLKKPHSQPHLPWAPPCKLIPCPNTLCCNLQSQHKYFHCDSLYLSFLLMISVAFNILYGTVLMLSLPLNQLVIRVTNDIWGKTKSSGRRQMPPAE